MFVCICNVIREADFRRAARAHDGDVEAIYAVLGYELQCGQCELPARRILERERAEATAEAAAAEAAAKGK